MQLSAFVVLVVQSGEHLQCRRVQIRYPFPFERLSHHIHSCCQKGFQALKCTVRKALKTDGEYNVPLFLEMIFQKVQCRCLTILPTTINAEIHIVFHQSGGVVDLTVYGHHIVSVCNTFASSVELLHCLSLSFILFKVQRYKKDTNDAN